MSVPEICLIPLQANERRQDNGVTFDFNDAPVKNDSALNPRRNMHSTSKRGETEQNTDIRLTASPTKKLSLKRGNCEESR